MPTETMEPPEGLFLVDKPGGWTSHDVVARVRRLAGTKKVGHAGTLDPMATGLLLLGIGRATKLLTFLVGADKTYVATIRLGSSTPTDDADSEPDQIASPGTIDEVTVPAIEDGVRALTGPISQVPSAVSAIKVDGVRSYKRVRDGEQVDLKPREVTVSRFDIDAVRHSPSGIDVDVVIDCTSGTYIRALARDLGAGLGVGGHLTALRRIRVGDFDVNDAFRLPSWDEPGERPAVMSLAVAAARCLPVRDVTEPEARALSYGQWIGESAWAGPTAAIGVDGVLVAVIDNTGGKAKPIVGFAQSRA
ncbi:tRNA pseudouridine(55) synthase TruB [Spelaeicoccus albus]|uniref:tRNA pseudouridine synthase B n=1 Tax=Spelaeicoccus albus TaxID=1280376 RepID=A0A7Z0D2S7_9MICO|nr:tRNA pseudouridine(55) synthase TruB [Spelaeicoccus albus]NYI67786.1 tRNA pseudouridine55 synthase [Spelaeicoccus albus]